MGLADRIKNMSALKAAIIGLAMAGVYYFFFFNSGANKKSQIVGVENELSALKKEAVNIEKTFSDAKRLKSLIGELGKSIDKVVKYIPEEFTEAEIVKNLSHSARLSGAKIVGIKSRSGKGGKSHEFYDELSVGVDLFGTYGQIMDFLARLTQIERIFTVRDMTFVRQQRDGKSEVKFSTVVVGYRYKSNEQGGKEK